MKHRHLFILSAVIAWSISLCSCAPDPIYSYPPEYEREVRLTQDDPKTLTLDNQSNITYVSNCQSGDSVTAIIRVSYTGAYITKAVYSWSLRDASGKTVDEATITQIAPHKQSTLPMWRFGAPAEAGTYYVHFRANYSYSAQAENGALFGGFPTSSNYEGASTVKTQRGLKVY